MTGELLGLVAGLVLGLFGSYFFEASGLKTRAAKTSKKRAEKRHHALATRLLELESLKRDPQRFLAYLGMRLVLINVLWLASNLLDYLLGLFANATNTALFFNRAIIPSVDVDLQQSLTYTLGSVVGAVTLVVTLNIAYRTYRTAEAVHNFDRHEAILRSEIADLRAVAGDRQSGAPPSGAS